MAKSEKLKVTLKSSFDKEYLVWREREDQKTAAEQAEQKKRRPFLLRERRRRLLHLFQRRRQPGSGLHQAQAGRSNTTTAASPDRGKGASSLSGAGLPRCRVDEGDNGSVKLGMRRPFLLRERRRRLLHLFQRRRQPGSGLHQARAEASTFSAHFFCVSARRHQEVLRQKVQQGRLNEGGRRGQGGASLCGGRRFHQDLPGVERLPDRRPQPWPPPSGFAKGSIFVVAIAALLYRNGRRQRAAAGRARSESKQQKETNFVAAFSSGVFFPSVVICNINQSIGGTHQPGSGLHQAQAEASTFSAHFFGVSTRRCREVLRQEVRQSRLDGGGLLESIGGSNQPGSGLHQAQAEASTFSAHFFCVGARRRQEVLRQKVQQSRLNEVLRQKVRLNSYMTHGCVITLKSSAENVNYFIYIKCIYLSYGNYFRNSKSIIVLF
jgi:hypothetical protein